MFTRALNRGRVRISLGLLCAGALAAPAWGDDPAAVRVAEDPAVLPAELMPAAAQSLLLDIVRTPNGDYVAVGERGHVLVSRDGGDWQQAQHVPTRSTLTAVAAAGDGLWAVGHDGVIIHSGDGGQHWERQRAAPWVPGQFDEEAGLPLLDVVFTDERHGVAVGAFSLLLETSDGGASWEPSFLSELAADAGPDAAPTDPDAIDGEPGGDPGSDDAEESGFEDEWGFSAEDLVLDEEDDPHLNAIALTRSGALLIAGERGTLFRQRGPQASWERLRLPYEGSMFGVLVWEDEHVMVFGLRGNVFESEDLGESWVRVESGTDASLMGGLALPGGGALLVGNEGRVLHRAAAGQPFRVSTHYTAEGATPVLSSAIDRERSFILLGERGIDYNRALEPVDTP